MTSTPETASSIRYRQAQAEKQLAWIRLANNPEQQWEAIARHYAANAHMASIVLTLLKVKSQTNCPLPDVDLAVNELIKLIKDNHLRDFGIALEWPST